MKKIEIGFDLAVENEQVIHGALKRAGVYHTRIDYEDFVQEGFITYAKCFVGYSREFDLEKFNIYAFQKIVWSTLDLLRKEQMYTQRFILESFEQKDYPKKQAINILELLQYENLKLSNLEREILLKHMINQVPLSEMSKKYEVSDRYLRRVRKNLKAKFLKNNQI